MTAARRPRVTPEQAARQARVWLELVERDAVGPVEAYMSPLRAVADATRKVAEGQREQADAVAQARRAGVPWSRIAIMLGVTRQGAKKRFGEPDGPVQE